MLENNLEGQVKEILEEFQLAPSDKLWDKVKGELSKPQKRRFVIMRTIILLGSLMLATYWLHDLEMKKITSFSASKTAIQAGATPAPVHFNANASESNPIKSQPDANELRHSTMVQPAKKSNTIALSNKKEHATNGNPPVKAYSTAITSHIPIHSQPSFLESSKSLDATVNTGQQNGQSVLSSDQYPVPMLNEMELITSNNVKESGMLGIKPTHTYSIPVQPGIETKIRDPYIVRKWACFFSLSGGVFSTGNGLFGFSAANMDYLLYPATSTGTGSAGMPYQTATIEPGITIYPAVKFKKLVSTKTQVSVGLGYQYASTSIKTGPLLSGSTQANYAVGTSNSFNNQYQFLQIPIEIESKLVKGLPLYVNAGLVYSRMISINALQYNASGNFYYKDNSEFNRNSIGITAGLQMAIFKKQTMQWLIGPQFNYGLTNFGTKGFYREKHAGYLGLQVQKKL